MTVPSDARGFLDRHGWGGAIVDALPGDASFRRYFRIRDQGKAAMLMHAPPPHEDPVPFITIDKFLTDKGFRAPTILAEDADKGLVLLEDFGDSRMRESLEGFAPEQVQAEYRRAIDTLLSLREVAPPDWLRRYDWAEYWREAELFTQWYCPAKGLTVDVDAYRAAWQEALSPLIASNAAQSVVVLRDYHAENLMLLDDGGQGLLDFQDALAGHPAYDLVSLLQDARCDVAPELEAMMLDYYRAQADADPDFVAHYHLLGAQRNMKIVGIFTRLWKRDGKPRYLAMIPRVWAALERDLADPALAPVKAWFDAAIPAHLRDGDGVLGGAFDL